MDADQLEALTNTELRDELLAHSPLDRDWVAAINQVPSTVVLCAQSLRCTHLISSEAALLGARF